MYDRYLMALTETLVGSKDLIKFTKNRTMQDIGAFQIGV